MITKNSAGFTIIEVMVTTVLVGMVAFAAAEALQNFNQSSVFQAAKSVRDQAVAQVLQNATQAALLNSIAPAEWPTSNSQFASCIAGASSATLACTSGFSAVPFYLGPSYLNAPANQAATFLGGPPSPYANFLNAGPVLINRLGVRVSNATTADFQVVTNISCSCGGVPTGGNCPYGYDTCHITGAVYTGSSTVPSPAAPQLLASQLQHTLPFGDKAIDAWINLRLPRSQGSSGGTGGPSAAGATHIEVFTADGSADAPGGTSGQFPANAFVWDVFPSCDSTGCFNTVYGSGNGTK